MSAPEREEPLDLGGRVALVTGGAGGLGRAMAEALVGAGAEVVIADLRAPGVEETSTALGDAAFGVVADVSTEEGVDRLVKETLGRFGHLDVLVNNAGIGLSEVREGDRYAQPIHFLEVTPEHLRRFFGVHVLGAFMLMRAAAPLMVERGWGRIVTVTTSLSTMERPGNAPYGPMKAASEAFTSIVAGDLGGTGVTANVLIPGGAADTPMVPESPGRSREALVAPSTMGPPMVWLASQESDGVSAMRFLSRLWDPTLPRADAARAAGFPIGWPAEH